MVLSNASRLRQANPAMSSATRRARVGLALVSTWMVMPASGTSDHGKPKNTLTNTSGSRASQVSARCTRSLHGDAPVHCTTVGEMIGTFTVTVVGA